ncbi:Zn-dependent exopeptidase [Mycena venus]|uniref:Peptide hydrolase n=1 Tax=Mycena venus TaxID=2733690 RepID=A0A8H6Z3D7_9AGAR|nr:Zn-dependent exopeptidase [Mycena venus]
MSECLQFDVTNIWEYKQSRIAAAAALRSLVTFPAPSKTCLITPLTVQLYTTRMNTYLTSLAALNNQYYTTSMGAAASTYVLSLISSFAKSGVGVSLFDHSWRQSSIIAKIPSTVAWAPVTILGAHMDSVNLSSSSSGLGALRYDGDGSGTVSLIEIFRVLRANASASIELHCSGKKAGLLGSQDIAAAYDADGVKVKAFMGLDMTAYFKPGSVEVIELEGDYIDARLNS